MSLGSTIASARKSAGMSLDDLAEKTSIRASLLREFETDNFEKCGGETYARGHVRNVAVALGVDPAILLELFDTEQSKTVRSIHDMLVENNVTVAKGEKNKVSIKKLAMISASVVILVGGGQIVISNFKSSNSTSSSKVEMSQPSQAASPSASAGQTPVSSNDSKVNLQLSATRGSTWLLVSDSTGTILFSGRLAQGESNSFASNEKINVRFGNAGAVDVLVNGIAQPSLGAVGEVVDRSFGANSSN